MEISKQNRGVKCTTISAYKYYFTIINGLLNLTKKEIDIVSKLYYYNHIISKSVTDPKLAGLLLFSKEYKGKIVKELSIKPLLLNNYISSLKEKSIILVDEKDGVNIKWLNPSHFLDIDKDVVQIVFNLKIEEEKEDVTEKEEPGGEFTEKEGVSEEEVPREEKTKETSFSAEDPWGTGANE